MDLEELAPTTTTTKYSPNLQNRILHTTPGRISTSIPSACGMTKISLNIIAASKSNLSIGIRVTSQANAGVLHISKKLCLARSDWNSNNTFITCIIVLVMYVKRYLYLVNICQLVSLSKWVFCGAFHL